MAWSLLVWLVAAIASLVCAVVVHELGHALGALLAGRQLVRLQLGVGRPRWQLRRQRPEVIVTPWLLLGGACVSDDARLPLRRAPIAIQVAAGPLANLTLGALCTACAVATSKTAWGWLAAGQLVVAVAQLVPLRLRAGHDSVSTDGWQLVALLRRGPSAGPSAQPDVDVSAAP